MEVVRRGNRPFMRLDVIHRENLDQVLRSWGLDPGAFDPAELDELNRAWHRLDPWPDSVEGLRRLRSGYFIAPLSNGNIALLANMAKRAGLPWDCILGAEVVHAYKPQPAAYLVQFQRTCWWSSSRRSHPKCWCTRSMSSWAVNV